MNTITFSKLSRMAQLQHVASTKRITIKEQISVDKTTIKLRYRAYLRGVAIGILHHTKEEAHAEGKLLLAKFKQEAQELHIRIN